MKNKISLRIISVLMSLLMLLPALSIFTVTTSAVKASAFSKGDFLQFGMYPQSRVTDSGLLTQLGEIDCAMINCGYKKNTDYNTHTFDAVDISYADIAFDGELYRKITINEYNPVVTQNTYGRTNPSHNENGYPSGSSYYFKWEPIFWNVLRAENDGLYIISNRIIDTKSYNEFSEDTTWETSSLRAWLNNEFFDTAFSGNEKEKIINITHSNENNPDLGTSGGNSTADNVWILSLSEIVNRNYGFQNTNDADSSKQATGTDYAKGLGLTVSNGFSTYWQRTPGGSPTLACVVDADGCTRNVYMDVAATQYGVRPVLKLYLEAEITESDPATCRIAGHNAGDPAVENLNPATCSAEGSYEEVVCCTVCGEEVSREQKTIEKISHTVGNAAVENETAATCSAEGSYDIVIYCSVCGEDFSRTHVTLEKLDHTPGTPVEENVVPSTCTEEGCCDEVVYCSECGEELTREQKTIEKISHTVGDAVIENEVAATCKEEGSCDEVVYCSECGEELSREQKTIEKISHTVGDAVIENEVAATCIAEGSYDIAVYCSVCGEEISRKTTVVESGSHSAGEVAVENVVAATCNENGSYELVICCVNCGEEISRETKVIEGGSHTAGEVTVENVVAATCSEDGGYEVAVYCVDCGEEISREQKILAKTGHIADTPEIENLVLPTEEAEGSYDCVTHCSVCGEELGREKKSIDKLEPSAPSEGGEEQADVCPWCGQPEHSSAFIGFIHRVLAFFRNLINKIIALFNN
ncbi:MAG: hypothetical protein IJK60_08085 [Clostridia bacterium]|nr:hypothetical protein [Clostridia bacterium]